MFFDLSVFPVLSYFRSDKEIWDGCRRFLRKAGMPVNKLDYAPPPAPYATTRAQRSAVITRAAILWPTLVPPTLLIGMALLRLALDDGTAMAWERAALCMTLPIALVTFLALRRTLRVMRVLRRTRQFDAWVITQIAVAVDVLVLVAVGFVVLA